MLKNHWSPRKCKLKSKWNTTVYPLEWLKLLQLTLSSCSKDMEQLEFSYFVGRNVEYYNHFVKSDYFLESEIYT